MRKRLLFPLALLSAPLYAADLQLDVEIPRLDVAEYHRPYVAIWLERPDQSHVANLAVWYDTKLKDKEGEKWLKDLRQWRSEEHTSELQSLLRISYAVIC